MGLAKKRPAERRALDADEDADLRADPEQRIGAPIKLKDRRYPEAGPIEPDDEPEDPRARRRKPAAPPEEDQLEDAEPRGRRRKTAKPDEDDAPEAEEPRARRRKAAEPDEDDE